MENTDIVQRKIETGRLTCIDALRGMAVALMLLGDNPGNSNRIYPQLLHAQWNGVTIADLGFPFFIMIMGMVVPYALNRRIAKGVPAMNIFAHVLIRSVEIFIFGLFLNGFPHYNFSTIRILGVLQRIAITYFIVSIVTLLILSTVKNKLIQASIQLGLALIIIIIYYLLLKHVTVPGFGKGILEQNGNLVQYIDMQWLKGHLYKPTWDPEGILSTMPVIASALFGAVTGQILIYPTDKKIYKFLTVLAFGSIILALAYWANIRIPFNKNLWTSSFVLLTAGVCFLFVAVLYFFMDIIKYNTPFKPFITLGSSAITVYVVSEVIRRTLWLIPIVDDLTKKPIPFKIWFTTSYITPWAGTTLDSAYFSVCYIILWIGIMSVFNGRKANIRL